MTVLLNVLWFILGGWISGLAWLVGAGILALTIIGLPWAPAATRIGLFAFAPFGRRAAPRRLVTGHDDLGTGDLGIVLNVVWLVLAGWWIALHHIVIGAAQAVTIIGLPFAFQHFKLAALALAPVGRTLVPA